MIYLNFPSNAFIGTNKPTRSDCSISSSFDGISIPHIKAYVTAILHPELPSLIRISEPHTNFGYPVANRSHRTTLNSAKLKNSVYKLVEEGKSNTIYITNAI
jgi:hypothetical protein